MIFCRTEIQKKEQENKKRCRNHKKNNRDIKKTTETGKIATGKQKNLQENKKWDREQFQGKTFCSFVQFHILSLVF